MGEPSGATETAVAWVNPLEPSPGIDCRDKFSSGAEKRRGGRAQVQ